MNIINKIIKLFKFGKIKYGIDKTVYLQSEGFCTTCSTNSRFISKSPWLRDFFVCVNCDSIPRERAIMHVIDTFFPRWRDLTIHESSPATRGASQRLKHECSMYIPSQYYPDVALGTIVGGVRCENLEALTFSDQSIDLHITQDVLEHVFSPCAVFREISRTLKPGGAHIFTVGLVNKLQPSRVRAKKTADGSIEHLLPPEYHGNPIDSNGSLVTVDWGFDICKHIFDSTGHYTQIIYIDDLSKGIRAEYIEVCITYKPYE